jgi:acyl-CoA synthetase (AMP-forming)/AMP-acid ligase II
MQKEDRMQTNVLEYLEKTVNDVPDKVAFADDKIEVTFQQFYDSCRAIGSYFSNERVYKEPVLIFMEKTPYALTAFFGTIYGGNYYVPIDDEMPKRRIELIIENTKARVFICDHNTAGKVDQLGFQGKVILFDDIIKTEINQTKLNEIREQSIDLDPIYVLFTSGSTGIPKGVVGHHRGVIDYIE